MRPPPEHPITSQIEGELSASCESVSPTRGIASSISALKNLIVLLHAFEKDTGAVPSDRESHGKTANDRFQATDGCKATRSTACSGSRRPCRRDKEELDSFTYFDKVMAMSASGNNHIGSKGRRSTDAAQGRASRSEEYREARDEYAAIRALRKKNWIAAHIRERRYELDLNAAGG